ncbi:GNAT family N-acetyltransferase [Massilibacteroides sp.]|uniref:GNAT family N-acetyltransferase n=1 Tax=Massilibacteroides sp. TaxID=2034766 RepID=UPI00261A356E|nr:GNAT family N-acetyltransferase [Massilibacteroides sp.]MDD4516144.1 GNAT family N-acetyltransferase [Massilibacteroides sp.]
MVRFKTPHLLVRDIESNDLETLLHYYRQKVNMRFISDGKYDWTLKELEEKYNKINKDYLNGYGAFAIELKETGEVIGEAGLFNSFKDPQILELGYIIDSHFWRKGYGKEVCQGLIDYGFKELGIKRLVARMYANNTASVMLSEICDMKLTHQGRMPNGDVYFRYEINNPDYQQH